MVYSFFQPLSRPVTQENRLSLNLSESNLDAVSKEDDQVLRDTLFGVNRFIPRTFPHTSPGLRGGADLGRSFPV